MAPRLELFAFRYRDPRTGKWIRARYRAEQHELERRFAEFEIIGKPEIRNVDPDARSFTPHEPFKVMMSAKLRRFNERPSELLATPPGDDLERFLVLVFLRRYVTYCARRRRFAAMNGAARLCAKVAARTSGPAE